MARKATRSRWNIPESYPMTCQSDAASRWPREPRQWFFNCDEHLPHTNPFPTWHPTGRSQEHCDSAFQPTRLVKKGAWFGSKHDRPILGTWKKGDRQKHNNELVDIFMKSRVPWNPGAHLTQETIVCCFWHMPLCFRMQLVTSAL